MDIWKAAHMMIEIYDLDAGWRAGLRADAFYEQGDMGSFLDWAMVARAIQKIQQPDQPQGDMRN